MSRVRTCGGQCHNAKGTRCGCWCGGTYHGSQAAAARAELAGARDSEQALEILQQHCFKVGETRYKE